MSPVLYLLTVAAVIMIAFQALSDMAEAFSESDPGSQESAANTSESSSPASRGSSTSSSSKSSTLSSNRTASIDPSAARKRVERAKRQAELAIDECRTSGKWEEAAVESYLLADSLEKMYHSSQYFGDGAQLDSYLTALKAAEDARDNVVDLQNSRTVGVDTSRMSPSQVEREYRRNMVASALMIAWCAGGLVGESPQEAARSVFQTPVPTSAVQNWNSFKKLLKNECEEYGAQ